MHKPTKFAPAFTGLLESFHAKNLIFSAEEIMKELAEDEAIPKQARDKARAWVRKYRENQEEIKQCQVARIL